MSEKRTDSEKAVKDFERKLILEALEKSKGVRSEAASMLKMKRTTLVEKMRALGMASRPKGPIPE